MPVSRIAMLGANPVPIQLPSNTHQGKKTNADTRTLVPATYMQTQIQLKALNFSLSHKQLLLAFGEWIIRWEPCLNSCDHMSHWGTVFCWRDRGIGDDNLKSDHKMPTMAWTLTGHIPSQPSSISTCKRHNTANTRIPESFQCLYLFPCSNSKKCSLGGHSNGSDD